MSERLAEREGTKVLCALHDCHLEQRELEGWSRNKEDVVVVQISCVRAWLLEFDMFARFII